jgi:hypothetical protein
MPAPPPIGDLQPPSFGDEESADLRRHYVRQGVRLAFAFGVLFVLVFWAFWWSGAAVRFGAARVTDRAATTWRVTGTVRNAVTRQPVPWAVVEDDSSGQPPFYRCDSNQFGNFELLTLPEPHRVHVSASGFHPTVISVGRAWFLWLPNGTERHDVVLAPEN